MRLLGDVLSLTWPVLRVAVRGLVHRGGAGRGGVAVDDMAEGGAAGAGRRLAVQAVGGRTGTRPLAQVGAVHRASRREGKKKRLYHIAKKQSNSFCFVPLVLTLTSL